MCAHRFLFLLSAPLCSCHRKLTLMSTNVIPGTRQQQQVYTLIVHCQWPFFLGRGGREWARWNQTSIQALTAMIQDLQKDMPPSSYQRESGPPGMTVFWPRDPAVRMGKAIYIYMQFAVPIGLILHTANAQTSRKRVDSFYFAANAQFLCISATPGPWKHLNPEEEVNHFRWRTYIFWSLLWCSTCLNQAWYSPFQLQCFSHHSCSHALECFIGCLHNGRGLSYTSLVWFFW